MDGADREWVERRKYNVLGHELRTPVTTIRGLAEVLTKTDDPARRAEVESALLRNARRLEDLVDDLLAATGVVTALPTGDRGEIDISATIRWRWGGTPGVRLVGEAGPAVARVRARSLDRILAVVMDNADKYGTRPTAVGVSRRDRSGRPVVVTTVDSPGPALPPEDIRLALEPFWRGERAVTTCPGMGLGLTVARTLAQHEGGRLWVEPRQGGGLITLLELEAA